MMATKKSGVKGRAFGGKGVVKHSGSKPSRKADYKRGDPKKKPRPA